MPRDSHYKAAYANDEELAEYQRLLNLPEPEYVVPVQGYSPEVERLDAVFNAINLLRETLVAVTPGVKKAPKPVRAQPPETAAQRIKRRESQKVLNSIVDQMTGGR